MVSRRQGQLQLLHGHKQGGPRYVCKPGTAAANTLMPASHCKLCACLASPIACCCPPELPPTHDTPNAAVSSLRLCMPRAKEARSYTVNACPAGRPHHAACLPFHQLWSHASGAAGRYASTAPAPAACCLGLARLGAERCALPPCQVRGAEPPRRISGAVWPRQSRERAPARPASGGTRGCGRLRIQCGMGAGSRGGAGGGAVLQTLTPSWMRPPPALHLICCYAFTPAARVHRSALWQCGLAPSAAPNTACPSCLRIGACRRCCR